MKLAAEIPTAHLEDLSPLFDFDFVIAHKLEDEAYRRFYLERKGKVMAIMDNGFHELGQPIQSSTLADWWSLLRPDYLISPDRLDDPDWTLEQARRLALRLPANQLAGNVFGAQPEDRLRMLKRYAELEFGMICFPYRKRHPDWFDDYELTAGIACFDHVHFLGAIDASETKFLASTFPEASIDTAKPIKWGLRHFYLDQIPNWRGGWKGAYDTYLNTTIDTPEQEARICYNIAYLRKLLA